MWLQLNYYHVEEIYLNMVFENYLKKMKCRSENNL